LKQFARYLRATGNSCLTLRPVGEGCEHVSGAEWPITHRHAMLPMKVRDLAASEVSGCNPRPWKSKLPVDSDWAENATGRKSTWGEAVLFCGTLFSSCTRTQSVIAQFFKGAELVQYGEWSLEGAWHPECAR